MVKNMPTEPGDLEGSSLLDLLGCEAVSRDGQLLEAEIVPLLDKVKRCLDSLAAGVIPVPTNLKGGLFVSLDRLITRISGLMDDLQMLAQGNLEFQAGQFGQYSELLDTITANLRQVTDQLVRQYLTVERLAVVDQLTGVQTRGALMRRFEEEFARASRYRGELSLLLLDLDDFKAVNDSHGHQAGDNVLRKVGAIINRQARLTDIAGRYGGEELMIVATETGLEGAGVLAERIRKDVEGEVFASTRGDFKVTVSIGISIRQPENDSLERLIERADGALYQAKRKGKNRIETQP